MVHLTVRNNVCYLTSDENDFTLRSLLKNSLTIFTKERRFLGNPKAKNKRFQFMDVPVPLYTVLDRDNLVYCFPRGLYTLLTRNLDLYGGNLDVIDESTDLYRIPNDEIRSIDIADVLRPNAPFSLRDDQILSVMKSLYHKRGIVQVPTGGGKTEIMSAIITILEERFPDIRLTVIEPTDVLVNKTTDRFNGYGLNAVRYKDIRRDPDRDYNVLVAHPTSLLNDTEDDPAILERMAGVFWDECQHCRCETWKALNQRLWNCEYALGFSALAVDEDHIYETNLRVLDPDEVLIEGATGPVIVNISPKYYIDNNILATPVVLQLVNDLGKGLYGCNDWSKLRKVGIESEGRTRLTARAVAMFNRYERRALVLVGTKRQAYDIAAELALEYDLSDQTAISFGAGQSYTVDPSGAKRTYDGEDVVRDFDEGRYSILISTSHMDEGVDLSNLDVAVLASGGKKDRRVVQRIGRALRNNKTGRYAYIVDFFDKGSGVLENHSNIRMNLYRKVIQIPRDLIYQSVESVESFVPYFEALEGIVEASPSERLRDQYAMLSQREPVASPATRG